MSNTDKNKDELEVVEGEVFAPVEKGWHLVNEDGSEVRRIVPRLDYSKPENAKHSGVRPEPASVQSAEIIARPEFGKPVFETNDGQIAKSVKSEVDAPPTEPVGEQKAAVPKYGELIPDFQSIISTVMAGVNDNLLKNIGDFVKPKAEKEPGYSHEQVGDAHTHTWRFRTFSLAGVISGDLKEYHRLLNERVQEVMREHERARWEALYRVSRDEHVRSRKPIIVVERALMLPSPSPPSRVEGETDVTQE